MSTPRSNFVKLRLTDLEKKDWQEAAGGERKVSAWLRNLANTEAQRLRDRKNFVPPVIRESTYPERTEYDPALDALPLSTVDAIIPNAKPTIIEHAIAESVQGEQAHRESRPLPATQALGDDSSSGKRKSAPGGDAPLGECPRWMHHRPGVYCGACKKVQKK